MFVAVALSTCSLIDLVELARFAIWNNKVVICQSGTGEGLENWTVQIKARICLCTFTLLHFSPLHIRVQVKLQVKLKSSILLRSWPASQHVHSHTPLHPLEISPQVSSGQELDLTSSYSELHVCSWCRATDCNPALLKSHSMKARTAKTSSKIRGQNLISHVRFVVFPLSTRAPAHSAHVFTEPWVHSVYVVVRRHVWLWHQCVKPHSINNTYQVVIASLCTNTHSYSFIRDVSDVNWLLK